MPEAFFVDPVCFSFLNPLTKIKKYLYIHVNPSLSFYEKIGMVTALALVKLGPEINDIHEQLIINHVAQNGFSIGQPTEIRPEWVLPHFVQCLPTRQGNGVVWEGAMPKVVPYWQRCRNE